MKRPLSESAEALPEPATEARKAWPTFGVKKTAKSRGTSPCAGKKARPERGRRRAMRPGKAQGWGDTGGGCCSGRRNGAQGATGGREGGGHVEAAATGRQWGGQPRGDGDGAPCTKTRRAFSPPKSHGRRVSGQGRQRAAMERRGQRGAVKVAVRHGRRRPMREDEAGVFPSGAAGKTKGGGQDEAGVPCRAFFPPCAAQKGRFRAGRAPSGACHGPSIGYLRKDGRTGRFSENNTLRTRRRGVTIWASFACPTAGFTFSFWAA